MTNHLRQPPLSLQSYSDFWAISPFLNCTTAAEKLGCLSGHDTEHHNRQHEYEQQPSGPLNRSF